MHEDLIFRQPREEVQTQKGVEKIGLYPREPNGDVLTLGLFEEVFEMFERHHIGMTHALETQHDVIDRFVTGAMQNLLEGAVEFGARAEE